MRLKQYQIRALERFEAFADALASKRSQNERWIAFQRGEGERNPQPQPWCETAWTSYLGTAGTWISRTDGIGQSVPTAQSIPTGGRKNSIGLVALEKLLLRFVGRQTGLVLWIVPSDSIYTQTRESFSDRQHPYRTYLERASAGRLSPPGSGRRFLTRRFERPAVCYAHYIADRGNVYENHDDIRRFHRSNGAFMQHFPPDDDIVANGALLQRVRICAVLISQMGAWQLDRVWRT